MAEEDQCKNILVLGQSNKTICRFVELFAIYVEDKGHKKFQKWAVQQTWAELPTPVYMKKDNKKLKLVPNSLKSFEAVLTNLQEFIKPQQVDALIVLLGNNNVMCQHFIERYYHGLKKLPILLVKFGKGTVIKNDTEELLALFSFKAFFDMQSEDNQHYTKTMDICQNMFNYIIKDTKKSFGVYFAIEQNLLLNFIDKLLDITMEIYLLSNCYEKSRTNEEGEKLLWTIDNCIKNVTVCCHKRCKDYLKSKERFIYLSNPKICEEFCVCNETDVAKCKLFDNEAKTCKCSHGADSHSKYFYSKVFKWTKPNAVKDKKILRDKEIALDVLATFCTYNKQNDQLCDLENLLEKKILFANTEQQSIYENAKVEFKSKLEAMDGTISIIDVIRTIKKLYDINEEITSIIPEIIKENFPKEFRLEISRGHTDSSGQTNELGALKKDVEEIKAVVDQIKVAQDEIKVEMLNALDAINKVLVYPKRQLEENTEKSKKIKTDTN